jgi:hypothetical protein
MATLEKYNKEIKELHPKEELDKKAKLEYIEKQLEGFQTQAYRFQIDFEVAKEYIKLGEERGEEHWITTGEDKIRESIGHLRSINVNIEKLCQIRDELKKK